MSEPADAPRYSRQVLFPPIGRQGQNALATKRVAVVGCGALGASLGDLLARAGIGDLVLIDRDIVELSNLGRQALYDTRDADFGLPKAIALARHLERFNPEIRIHPKVLDLGAATIDQALLGADLVLDGTDNLAVRYLLNDHAVKHGYPWIYGACIAARGMTATIRPGQTPCLACLFEEPPPAGSVETCDTSGIIAPAAVIVASLQVTEALKLLVGAEDALRPSLVAFELWPFRVIELGGTRPEPRRDCRVCAQRRFDHLDQAAGPRCVAYCGRDAVQIIPAGARPGLIDLAALERRLQAVMPTRHNGFVLRIEAPEARITVFDDGRALIAGVSEALRAQTLYDRYVGR